MIQALAMSARMACARTSLELRALHDSVERACCLAGSLPWDRKAAAHAEIFSLLADMVDDRSQAPLLAAGPGYVLELMLAVGRVADGMIVSSRRRSACSAVRDVPDGWRRSSAIIPRRRLSGCAGRSTWSAMRSRIRRRDPAGVGIMPG